uniref:Uncharacterized protein n=1 Tax=uncultured verrucomicrobium HF0130_25O04 TaxID=723596 RepID=E7C338_9BACT|nr:hypothetical protein [uncultured verrucomicrobium HF0130_25O04]
MNGPPPKFFTIKASKIEIAGGLIKRENLNPVEERKRMPIDQMAISTPRLNTMNLERICSPNKEIATGNAK